jgi:glucose-6-phosphate 1-dehydrogenase
MKTKLLIFGITGDLSTRKLLPALEQITSTGNFGDLSVIGVSRHEVDPARLFTSCVNCGSKTFLDNKLSMFTMDLNVPSDYVGLKKFISLGDDEQLLIYMAVPPTATAQIVDLMGEAGLNTPNVKILFEKPFGTDLSSAEKLIEQTSRHYQEEQIYRIDHYLAKEMAQNIVAFRGRNVLFSDIWNNKFIKSIEVVAAQKIDIEGRTNFYEQTGALRDVVQGHLMQLLVLTLMDIPTNFEWDKMPEFRLEAFSHLQLVDLDKVIRAQYQGYRSEVDNSSSNVETFVSIGLVSNQSRWDGVPITITTGKALNETKTEIRIHLKSVNGLQGNCLIFRIQPNEGIDIELFVKKPGYSREFETHHLSFNYPADTKLPDAYEQVLVDAISSQKSLFASNGEVLQSWRILQPIQDEWASSKKPLKLYEKGSSISSILA